LEPVAEEELLLVLLQLRARLQEELPAVRQVPPLAQPQDLLSD
jgi:hypothetical protein